MFKDETTANCHLGWAVTSRRRSKGTEKSRTNHHRLRSFSLASSPSFFTIIREAATHLASQSRHNFMQAVRFDCYLACKYHGSPVPHSGPRFVFSILYFRHRALFPPVPGVSAALVVAVDIGRESLVSRTSHLHHLSPRSPSPFVAHHTPLHRQHRLVDTIISFHPSSASIVFLPAEPESRERRAVPLVCVCARALSCVCLPAWTHRSVSPRPPTHSTAGYCTSYLHGYEILGTRLETKGRQSRSELRTEGCQVALALHLRCRQLLVAASRIARAFRTATLFLALVDTRFCSIANCRHHRPYTSVVRSRFSFRRRDPVESQGRFEVHS